MKRILFLCFLASFFCFNAKAQLNITAAIEEYQKPERLLVCQVSYSFLYKTQKGFEFWAKTDNQFDKHYTTLFLGNTYETAMQTLKDLNNLIEKRIHAVEVQQEDGNITLTFFRQLGMGMLWIRQVGQGGKSWISESQIIRMIRYFEQLEMEDSEQSSELDME